MIFLTLAFFAFRILAASLHRSVPHTRRDDPASQINTTILSASGKDVTSSFQIMIYNQPNTTTVTGLSDRQVSSARPINFCESPTAIFILSRCKHSDPHLPAHDRATLQDYSVTCVESTEQPPRATLGATFLPGYPNLTAPYFNIPDSSRASGRCNHNEICVDGQFENPIAWCVSTEYFVRKINSGERQDTKKIGELAGKTAQMIVSHSDKSTPMRVKGIDLRAEVIGESNTGAGTVQERECQYCFELGTQKMEEGTDFLRTEASLMSAATVITGVVFLILSG